VVLAFADPHEHREAVRVGERDVVAQRDHVGGAVLAVDQHEVEPGDRQHLDELLARHPHQSAGHPIAGEQAGTQGRHLATRPGAAVHVDARGLLSHPTPRSS
jgi:hypothetical protein